LPDLRNFQGNIICAYISSILLTTCILIIIFNIKVNAGDNSVDSPETGNGTDLTGNENDETADEHGEFYVSVSRTSCQALGYVLYCSGFNFTNILHVPFVPIFLGQKITKPKRNHRKAARSTFIQKICM